MLWSFAVLGSDTCGPLLTFLTTTTMSPPYVEMLTVSRAKSRYASVIRILEEVDLVEVGD